MCPHDRPSPIFVVFSVGMNILLCVFAFVGLISSPHESCDHIDACDPSGLNLWLGVCLGIAAVNMTFAGYLYWKFSHMTAGADRVGAGKAAWQLCMKDIGVFLYLCFAIFIGVWAIMGPGKECAKVSGWCDDKENNRTYCVIVLWVYMVMCFALCLSFANPQKHVC